MSEDRLVYKGQDVTLDVTLKIEHVVRIIAESEQIDFDDAYARFAESRAYAALQKPTSLMWAESAEYIADRYFEQVTA
ncbi:MAG: hypothetical protein LBR33_06980 [Propionibacteriaceae bacterium]|jgi:hypothetical protein|nr:hypothetical protein [Propionibacteriaceae bacterium]